MEIGIIIFTKYTTTSVDEQIKALKECGIRRTFLDATQPNLDTVIKLLHENNITCDTLHGVFNEPDGYTVNDLYKPGTAGDIMLERLLNNITTCTEYNIPVLIVHFPDNEIGSDYKNEHSERRFKKLGEFARQNGVILAFENTGYCVDCFNYTFDLIPDAKFCYDTGHEFLYGGGHKFLSLYGDKLVALHLSDNHGEYDDHIIPFDGILNFDEIAKNIAKCSFSGTVMLEVPYKDVYADKITYNDFLLRAKSSAEKLASMIKIQA